MAASETTIPIVEETARIEKKLVNTGKVRVQTVTEVLEELASAQLETSDLEIVRVPIDREVEQAPAITTMGETIIVPVLEEVLVVKKRLVLREEVHIKRRVTTEQVDVPVALRKQRAIVSREGHDAPTTENEDQYHG